MKKILLINFGGIGDEILFLPVIRAAREKFPDAHITLCLEGRSSAFIQLTDLIDSHFCIDIKTKNKYFEMLRLYFRAVSGGYDMILSSGSNPLIAVLLFFTGIKTRIGYISNGLSKKLLTHPVKLNKNQYAAKMYYDLAKAFTDAPFENPRIEIKGIETEKNSIVIHPGAGRIGVLKNIIKTPDAQIWADIIIKLLKKGKKVYLAGGPDDKEYIEKIMKLLKNHDLTNFKNMYGGTKNIKDLAALIKKPELLICADSAPMHLGIALGVKTAALFGPTDEKLLLPDSAACTAVTNSADCRPCLWNKRQTVCRELKCLKFDADKILDCVQTYLNTF